MLSYNSCSHNLRNAVTTLDVDCKVPPHEAALAVETTAQDDAYFFLTGFVDGLVKVPADSGNSQSSTSPEELRVVEVKHRMTRIQDPPAVHDIIQMCTYCRALGIAHGDLVQCLRRDTGLSAGSQRCPRGVVGEGSCAWLVFSQSPQLEPLLARGSLFC